MLRHSFLQILDAHLTEVKDGCRQTRIDIRDLIEKVQEVLDAAGAAGSDHRDFYRIAYGAQHREVEPLLHPVGIYGVDDDLPCAAIDALFDPGDRLHPGIVPAAFGEDPVDAIDQGDIRGQDHALVSVEFGCLID